MIIDLRDGTRLALGCETGLLTQILADGSRKRVVFAEQLRGLLAPLGAEAMQAHLDSLRAWCEIALDRHSRIGVKATKQTRARWADSLSVVLGALSLIERDMQEAA
jgi:hypothetical protein